MHVLDTDTLVHLDAGHTRVVEHAQSLPDSEVGTTLITRIELLRGRFDFLLKASDGEQLLRAQLWLERSERLLSGLLILPVDEAAAESFDKLLENKRLKKVGRADLLIASIVLARRAVLVTRNVRHFRQVPNLRVVNWVDEP
jgi:tRNA(fMet)-specific endonuclease VapC